MPLTYVIESTFVLQYVIPRFQKKRFNAKVRRRKGAKNSPLVSHFASLRLCAFALKFFIYLLNDQNSSKNETPLQRLSDCPKLPLLQNLVHLPENRNHFTSPVNPMKASERSPAVMRPIGAPLSEGGTLEMASRSRMPAKSTRASMNPRDAPRAKNRVLRKP